MIPPRPAGVDAEAWAALFGGPLAHRGLWSAEAPENSLAAFRVAAEAGYGMEFDVQLSADGEVVVFHDDRLDRMTSEAGRVGEQRFAELSQLSLAGTEETIPTLSQALAAVDARTLVLVELKVLGGEEGLLERRVKALLDDYDGPAAVLSFNPKALGWFADHAPHVLRGLNSTSYHDAANWMLPAEERRALLELEHVNIARPHFLSLGTDMLPSASAEALRARGLPVAAWTIRSPAQWARVAGACDTYMFEGFRPEAHHR